jgi:predicted ATPase
VRITSLSVKNFRAISDVDLTGLSDAVVLAGPNGCGKSCVLDAIRLLKSSYGSYEQDEVQQFFGEYQIDARRELREAVNLLQDKSQPMVIEALFTFSEEERQYLRANLPVLATNRIYRQLTRNQGHIIPGEMMPHTVSNAFSGLKPQIDTQLPALLRSLAPAIDLPTHVARLQVSTDGSVSVQPNGLLELVFATYIPQHLGVIDFHGAHRTYNRNKVTSVNLTIEGAESQLRQTALYNAGSKYSNLKAEMTAQYIRGLLISEADPASKRDDSLTSTLKELFTTFFPGKEFLGPQPTPDGRITFLVRLANGMEHDIDELSSGEKEVVYGYLRLQNTSAKHSMIMIDEPELHLNPRLVNGLAAFYYRHLGAKLGNQLWLVTHSDTLIREAVDHPNFSVFHIHPAGANPGSQATAVKAKGELERVVLALVGDLAAYRPGAKIVVFESTIEAAFDRQVTCLLFPELEQVANTISAGSKRNVEDLYHLLEAAREAGHIDTRFFAITDADDDGLTTEPASRFRWDVYHIENYLISMEHLLEVIRSLGIRDADLQTIDGVSAALRVSATKTVSELVAHKLRTEVNKVFVSEFDYGYDPKIDDAAAGIAGAVARCVARINERSNSTLSSASLNSMAGRYRGEYEAALKDGSWIKKFRGRDVLKRFVSDRVKGVNYERFRSLVLNRMAQTGYRPAGMKTVVDAILAA